MEETLGRLAEESRARLRAYADLRDELSAATTTVTAPDGGVRVTVGNGGAVELIAIEDEALDLGADRLSAVIISTIQLAQARAALTTARAVQVLLGPQLNINELVESAMPAQLRAQVMDDNDEHGG